MAVLALLGSIWCIFTALRGKGKMFMTKLGTPLSDREAQAVRKTYLAVGILLLIVAIISGIQLITDLNL